VSGSRRSVGILVFDLVEVLDFAGPFEVFSITRLDERRRREDPGPFEVHVVAERAAPVTATGGLRVEPSVTTADCPPLDVLVVPGGHGTRRELDNPALIGWIAERARTTPLVTSVCTGSLLLGRAGRLDGRHATTHFAALDLLERIAPAAKVVRDRHVVTDGDLVTSAGVAAGIDMALVVVARLLGEPVARQSARHMEYPYPDDLRRRV
jgi:transcriptional regulator GlxA family with amidase domain